MKAIQVANIGACWRLVTAGVLVLLGLVLASCSERGGSAGEEKGKRTTRIQRAGRGDGSSTRTRGGRGKAEASARGKSTARVIVTGRVTLPDGKPATSASVLLCKGHVQRDWRAPVLSSGIAATSTTASGSVEFSGRVLLDNGLPASRARVVMHRRGEASEETDENSKGLDTYAAIDGSYKLNMRVGVRGRLLAEKEGWVGELSEPIETGRGRMDINLTLSRGARISGKVLGPEGAPVEGAEVKCKVDTAPGSGLMCDSYATERTNAKGEYTLKQLRAGKASLTAAKEGLAPMAPVEMEVRPASELRDVVFRLGKAHEIQGRVVDQDDKPLSGSEVFVSHESPKGHSIQSVADSEGRFALRDLPAGKYRLYARKEHCEEVPVTKVKAGETTVVIVLKRIREDVVMTGRVVDARTREPISNFEVKSENGETQLEKDPSRPGVFLWKRLHGDVEYKLFIKAPGYLDLSAKAGNSKSDFSRTFELGQGGAVTGRAVEVGTGKALAGVQVLAGDGVSPAMTDAEGRFRLERLVPGRKTLQLRPKAPLLQRDVTFAVEHGETSDVGDVELGQGGVVRGRVLRRPGDEPVGGTEISLGMTTKRTTADGRFEFSGLAAGEQPIRLTAYEQLYGVRLEANETVERDLYVGGATLNGLILAGEKPWKTGVILINAERTGHSLAKSGEDGRFSVKGLAPGKWQVMIGGPGEALIEDIEIGSGSVERTFHLPSGKLVGRVEDSSDAPVEGARICVRRSGGEEEQIKGFDGQFWASPDGSFEKEGFTEGTYFVTARKEGVGNSQTEAVQIPATGGASPVRLRLGAPSGVLESVALSMRTGEPLREASVVLRGERGVFDAQLPRDEAGRATIQNVPAGSYTLTVGAEGYASASRTVEIRGGETLRVEDVLQPGSGVCVVVLNSSGGIVVGAHVRCVAVDANAIEPPREGVTSWKGYCDIPGVPAGRYRIEASFAGATGSAEATVWAGGGSDATVRLK